MILRIVHSLLLGFILMSVALFGMAVIRIADWALGSPAAWIALGVLGLLGFIGQFVSEKPEPEAPPPPPSPYDL